MIMKIYIFLLCIYFARAGSTKCVDKNKSCQRWAKLGECVKSKRWMHKNCQKSCNSCKSWSGPFEKIWHDGQCANIGNGGWRISLTDCKTKCEDLKRCTAINYGKRNYCVFRACTLPIPQPQKKLSGYAGYVQGKPCLDHKNACNAWARKKFCVSQKYKKAMGQQCCKSCKGKVEPCLDNPLSKYKKLCKAWVLKKYCVNPEYKKAMQQLCCKSCKGPPPTRTPKPSPTLPGNCGKRRVPEGRVIGGTDAYKGQWPWQILLIMFGTPKCGGTLISDRWVVTAAHCIIYSDTNAYVVRVGELDQTRKEGTEVDTKVSKVVVHPDWDVSKLNNDIALLKLEKPVSFTKYVQPACLPTKDATIGDQHCYITGWGKIKFPGPMYTWLQEAIMPPVDSKVCDKKNQEGIKIPVTPAMLCAGEGGKTNISGCHGDSGGPYVCPTRLKNGVSQWSIQGVVSHGSGTCNSTETYTVFARVYYFKKWILAEMFK